MSIDHSLPSLRFGYASQNLTIPATTGRTLRLANLSHADRVRELVVANLGGMEKILRWNAEHSIGLFRMSQQIVPFASHPDFPYDWEREHAVELRRLGNLARSFRIRLSLHPGQFIQPGSENGSVRERSMAELRYVARLLSLLGSDDSVLVLHLGGAYGDKGAATRAFLNAMHDESEVLQYLALENDERIWTVREVAEVALGLGVPAIVDTLHHRLNSGGIELRAALDLALSSWPGRPKVHISSQNPEKQTGAHASHVTQADFWELVDALHETPTDIMVEAKAKEDAVLALQNALRDRQPVT